jgi:hypothetical protein
MFPRAKRGGGGGAVRHYNYLMPGAKSSSCLKRAPHMQERDARESPGTTREFCAACATHSDMHWHFKRYALALQAICAGTSSDVHWHCRLCGLCLGFVYVGEDVLLARRACLVHREPLVNTFCATQRAYGKGSSSQHRQWRRDHIRLCLIVPVWNSWPQGRVRTGWHPSSKSYWQTKHLQNQTNSQRSRECQGAVFEPTHVVQ